MLNLESKNIIIFHLLGLFCCFPQLLYCAFPPEWGAKSVGCLSELLASAQQFQQFIVGTHPSVKILFPLLHQQAGWDQAELISIRLHYLTQTTYGNVEHLDLFLFTQIKFLKNWNTPAYVLCYRNSQFLFWQAKATQFDKILWISYF